MEGKDNPALEVDEENGIALPTMELE